MMEKDFVPIWFDEKKNVFIGTNFNSFEPSFDFNTRVKGDDVIGDKIEVPIEQMKSAKYEKMPSFVTIFHPTRARSTVFLRDFHLSDEFFCLNEPHPYDRNDELLLKTYSQMIQNFQEKTLCLKAHSYLSFHMRQFVEHFETSTNYFLYRNPYDVFLSNLEKKYFNKDLMSNDALRLKEILGFSNMISKIFKTALELHQEGKLQIITYDELYDPMNSFKIFEQLGLNIPQEKKDNIMNARKFEAHRGKEVYKPVEHDRSKYQFELTFFKAKTDIDQTISNFEKELKL